ncbi:MAG: MBL fold metallo-hydrolase [Candidatus Terrybacteria bacterium]|nr:MBL fold metallo-hydrolase [Candidatus Terrybacteria bacterium]
MQNFGKNFRYFFLCLLVLACFFVWYAVYAENRQGLEVYFLDVGQGDAIFIETSNGNQILIDAGPNRQVLRELSKVMPFYDRSIDVVMESHPDSDHIGGLPEVLGRYDVTLVIESGVGSDNAVYVETEKIISEKRIKKILARRGMQINLGDGAHLDILFPDRDISGLDTNDASIVARLIYGENEFLFTGDSPKKMEKYLVSLDGNPPAGGLQSDVLKLGHHGSKTSSSEEFLGYVKPLYAVISAGKNNRYGHPHQEILERLNQFKIPYLRTDEKGIIKIKTDGENLHVF